MSRLYEACGQGREVEQKLSSGSQHIRSDNSNRSKGVQEKEKIMEDQVSRKEFEELKKEVDIQLEMLRRVGIYLVGMKDRSEEHTSELQSR